MITFIITSASAHAKLEVMPAFRHPFKKVDVSLSPLPEGMTKKEGMQVKVIHNLLTALLDGVDNNGEIEDQIAFHPSSIDLSC
jgi:hypothetical protein